MHYQVAIVGGQRTSGKPDAYRLFFERSYSVCTEGGSVGLVLPSSFHAAEGATGIRDLCLRKMELRCCFSFENKRSLFEIHKSYKYATVIADKVSNGSDEFAVAFYLQDDAWLFEEDKQPPPLFYVRQAIVAAGGGHHVFPECRSQLDFDVLAAASERSAPLGSLVETMKVDLRQGMSVTREASKRLPLASTYLRDGTHYLNDTDELAFPVHEGKTFTDFADSFDSPIREIVPLSNLSERAHWRSSVRFYRLAQRLIASSTNQRTSIFAMLPPGVVCVHSARIEATPAERPDSAAMWLCAVWNSFAFDFLSRIRVGSNVSEFIVNLIPMKVGADAKPFLAHAALRLSANHAGYEPLWREQLGEAWREAGLAWTWPALSGDDARWAVRAAIDAVVAAAYGLTREQYTHVLSTFSHASYRKAPDLCLAAFDELKDMGLNAFARKHDPYADVPLNESLPKPVIQLAKADAPSDELTPVAQPSRAAPAVPARMPQPATTVQSDLGMLVEVVERPSWHEVSTTDRHVALLARITAAHEGKRQAVTLGSVKAEKISHLFEAHFGIDLGREPQRLAAGPVDFGHLNRVAHRAEKKFAFKFSDRETGEGHEFIPLNGFRKSNATFEKYFATRLAEMDAFIALFVPMLSARAEAIATLYAVWNDLLASHKSPGDEDIITGFYSWDPKKAAFRREDLIADLAWMRHHQLVPTGKGKPSQVLSKPAPAKRRIARERPPTGSDMLFTEDPVFQKSKPRKRT